MSHQSLHSSFGGQTSRVASASSSKTYERRSDDANVAVLRAAVWMKKEPSLGLR
tara:strand:- start:581 stop:742 length:162 start_codon:yes stop_codon:yes gene_type:complete